MLSAFVKMVEEKMQPSYIQQLQQLRRALNEGEHKQ